MDLLLIGLVVVMVGVGLTYAYSIYRKGCCEKTEAVASVSQPKGASLQDYPYRLKVDVQGMSCENCLTKTVNELSKLENVIVKPEKQFSMISVYSKQPLDQRSVIKAVRQAGYMVNAIEGV